MTRRKAVLVLDPRRADAQRAFVAERAENVFEIGGRLWASITEDQGPRFGEQGIQVQFDADADLVEVPAACFDPLASDVEVPESLRAPEAGGAPVYHLVQFHAPPQPEWVAEVGDLGGAYVQDQPVLACVFRLTAAQAQQTRALPFVRWVGLYHPAFALNHLLAGRDEPILSGDLRTLAVDPARLAPDPAGSLAVTFFDDVTSASMSAPVAAAGATVVSDGGNFLIINAGREEILRVLGVEGVHSVETYRKPDPGVARAGVISTVDEVRSQGQFDFLVNLDGTGEIVGVVDTGLDAGGPPAAMHPDLAGRVLIVRNINGGAIPTNDMWPHGTVVTGVIAGSGAQSIAAPVAVPSPTRVVGIAPASQIVFESVNNSAAGALSYVNHLTGFTDCHGRGARVINNSWGVVGAVTSNAYQNGVSGGIDRFAFLNPETLLVFISQNDETDANGNGVLDQNRLPPEGVGKNILCVGACESITNLDGDGTTFRASWAALNFAHAAFNAAGGAPPVVGNFPMSDNADEIALFSKRGRVALAGASAANRRVKPDLVAPGTNIMGTGPIALLPMAAPRVAVTAPPGFYYVTSGTSLAAPVVSGAAVLTRQYYRTVHGRLRRPLLLEALPDFVDQPTIAPHVEGWVAGWIRRTTVAPLQNNVVAGRHTLALVRLADPVQLQADVGASPVPALARHGEQTVLVHRHGDNTIRLSLFDRALVPVAGFGAGGTVTLAPNSRSEDNRGPALCVQADDLTVAWCETGTSNLLFRRFRADTGTAIDGAAVTLGSVTRVSTHSYLVHNGTAYFAVWIHQDGADWKVLFRKISNAGVADGAAPIALVTQAAEMAGAHLAWDARQSRFLVTWIDYTNGPQRDLRCRRFRADGTSDGPVQTLVSMVAGRRVRRPFVSAHPDSGWVAMWEDDSQGPIVDAFDVYARFLLPDGALDPDPLEIPDADHGRVSDTPLSTRGFGGLSTADGVVLTWQSEDEINADFRGVYAAKLTRGGTFLAQSDPQVPLLKEARYVSHLLGDHDAVDLGAVGATWAGGDFFILREVPTAFPADTLLMRLNADGLPDPAFGGGGARRVNSSPGHAHLELQWVGNRIVASMALGPFVDLRLFDAAGGDVAGFGTGGFLQLAELADPAIIPQLAQRGAGAAHRIFVTYGLQGAPPAHIRYLVLNGTGAAVTGPMDLPDAVGGTARHGWFHLATTETPVRSIAAWHRLPVAGPPITVFLNRFNVAGAKQHAAPIQLTLLPGESRNAVIAPRPVQFRPAFPTPAAAATASLQREYGAAWQNQPVGGRWEIRFSRLNRDGTVHAVTRDVAVVQRPAAQATDPQLVWHSDGYGLAWLEQPVAGGDHTLFFTVLGEAGLRVDLAPLGAPAALVGDFQVNEAGGDVQDFRLVWTGRSFRIVWSEVRGGRMRHLQRSLIVPRQQGMVNAYDQPFQHPSSALVRATLINGATNLRNLALPAVGNLHDGYGWGRLNLRQSLAPAAPAVYQARDDASVAAGQTARYEFSVPPGAQLLRVALVWTDPPGNRIVNNLNLRVTVPAGGALPVRVFVGNRWQAGAPQLSDPLPAVPPPSPFNDVHPIETIVVQGAPTLPSGVYRVDVLGGGFTNNSFQQFPGQPFALVFVASGPEFRFPAGGALPAALPVY